MAPVTAQMPAVRSGSDVTLSSTGPKANASVSQSDQRIRFWQTQVARDPE
jgi:hypothetical protein